MKWQGVKVRKLLQIRKILEEWILINHSIYSSWEGDIPWRYGERSALSVFSGAIWRLGGIVLEEFSTQKRDTKTGWGRADLYIELEEFECEIEAKHVYAEMIGPKPDEVVSQTLNDAINDISRNQIYDDRHQIGLAHITPIITYNSLSNFKHILTDWPQFLKSWLSLITNLSYDACAWYFPKDMPFTRYVDSKKDEHYMPGTIILLQEMTS